MRQLSLFLTMTVIQRRMPHPAAGWRGTGAVSGVRRHKRQRCHVHHHSDLRQAGWPETRRWFADLGRGSVATDAGCNRITRPAEGVPLHVVVGRMAT
ncbi:MAG: hypothetical protein H6672_13385 [Anaerolineaceae bacterium]|nr:hypothetical protein [Anaerolineaceae bacterium]